MRRLLQILGAEVAKVKKVAGVRGERNAKVRGTKDRVGSTKTAAKGSKAVGTSARKVAKKRAPVRPVKAVVKRGGSKRGAGPGARVKAGARRQTVVKAPVVRVAIKELDPLAKCGPNTSVQFLYRVDESVDGRKTFHLVFFDHHGWYCEHGRACPAVGHARKHNGQIARVS
jgi:hypothetical protein